MKEFFTKAFQSIRDNGQHVLFGYPYTSATLVLVGFIIGAWVL